MTKEPVTAEELQAFASARLAKFEAPRPWEFRDSPPKTPTQRVERGTPREGGAAAAGVITHRA